MKGQFFTSISLGTILQNSVKPNRRLPMIYSFHNSSFRDQQTGLYNEAYFMEVLYREWHRLIREQKAMSILVVHPHLDISNSRGFDEYRQLAHVLDDSIYRSTDLVSRFCERKFIIGLFDLAQQDAMVVIDRILARINQSEESILQVAKSTFIGALHVCPSSDVDINEVFDSAVSIDDKAIAAQQEQSTAMFQMQQYRLN